MKPKLCFQIDPSERRPSMVRDRLASALAGGPYTRAEWLRAANCTVSQLDRHYGHLLATGVVVQRHLTERIQISASGWKCKTYTLYCLKGKAPKDRRVLTFPLGTKRTPRQPRK